MVARALSVAAAAGVLPSGLAVPPLPYLAVLLVGTVAVATAIARERPTVTGRLVVAFAPWMVAGAAGHAVYQLDAAPAAIEPLLGAPAVYVTTFVLAGALLAALLAVDADGVPTRVAAAGALAALVPVAVVFLAGARRGTLALTVPALALVASVVLAGVALAVLDRTVPVVRRRAGWLGALVVFGHALDGVSTAVGVDLLGTGERSPLPRAIMDLAADLPTAELLGTGWLFVLVKLAVAVGVLWLFEDFLAEDPAQANLLLGVIAAVGLGPGAHNLLLFAAAGGL